MQHPLQARVVPGNLPRRFVSVDPAFAARLDQATRRLAEERTAEAASALNEVLGDEIDRIWATETFARPVDYSGVAHLTVDPTLAPGTCRVPRTILTELLRPQIYGTLERRRTVSTIKSARRMVELDRPEVRTAVDDLAALAAVLLASGGNVIARTPIPWDLPAIGVDAATARRFPVRTVTIHLPITHEARFECSVLPDLPTASPPKPAGWLSRAIDAPLVDAVRLAAASGETEGVEDPVLSCVLGRPPRAPDPEGLADWQRDRTAAEHAADARAAKQATEAVPPPT